MRFWLIPIVMLALLTLAGPPPSAAAPPVVRAVLFYSDLCGNCHQVINNVLPPLQAKYGASLRIDMIEVSSPQERARLRTVAAAMGIPAEHVGVPLLVIGNKALLGADQIPAELPGLIDTYLAQGGVDTYTQAGLESLAAAAGTLPTPTEAEEPTSGFRNGFALALALMAAMVAALILVAVALVRGWPGPDPRVVDVAIPVIAVLGMLVAVYLSYIETRGAPAICGPVGDCNTVQNSPYARFLGVPVGALGLVGYVAILAAWLWQRVRRDTSAVYARLALFGMSLMGVLFSLYLTYLEVFVIEAVCAWCLTSALLMTLMFLMASSLVAPRPSAALTVADADTV